MKFFFHKYIVIESLVEELHSLDLSDEEKHHLANLADASINHAIMDEILSNLNTADKKLFLKELQNDPENEKLMDFLREKTDNIEDKIKDVSEKLIKELHKDVKESKQIK